MAISRRTFGQLVGALPASALAGSFRTETGIATEPPNDQELPGTSLPWYVTKRRWTTFNVHYQDWNPEIASRLNSGEIMRNLLISRANVFMLDVGDLYGNLYYPSHVGRMHPNLQQKDLVSKVVAGCKANGIAIVIYYCLSWNKGVAQHHPEWVMKDNQNKMVGYDSNFGPLLCYNSGYLEFVEAITRELLDFVPDGLFYDMLWFGTTGTVCYCQENCQPLFRQKYGIDMPLSAGWDDAWRKFLEFRYDSNLAFAQKLNTLVKNFRPAVSVCYNYHGGPPQSWQAGQKPVAHRLISDFATGEIMPNWLGHWYPSMLTTFVRSLKPGSPMMTGSSRCVRTYSDYTLRPSADLKWEVFTYFAHGASVEVVDDSLYDGSLQPEYYEELGKVFGEAEEKEAYFGHEHVREVGLYYSQKSRDWYGRETPERYQSGFIGAHRALAELHIPVDALFDETISLEQISKYPIVFLAETAILDEDELRLLRQYVRGGGRLIATHDAGLYGKNGNRLADFVFADVFGIRYKGEAEFANDYYRLPRGLFSTDLLPDYDVLVTGTANIVESAGATTVGELKIPFYDGPPFHAINLGDHNPPWKTVGPAIFINRYGSGQTVYVPFGLDSAYIGDQPLPEHRILLRNLLRHVYPNPRVRVDAPLAVEVVTTEDKEHSRYIIHFIGYQAPRVTVGVFSPRPRPVVMEEALLYRATIHLEQAPRSVRALSPKSQVKQTGASISLVIEDIHEAVVVSY